MSIDRRSSLTAVALAPAALAPTPRDWSGQQLVRYADPDVIALDKRFEKYKIDNTTIQRLWTGALWAEGLAWNGAGRYLVRSDIPNNRQMRWLRGVGESQAAVPQSYRARSRQRDERSNPLEAGRAA